MALSLIQYSRVGFSIVISSPISNLDFWFVIAYRFQAVSISYQTFPNFFMAIGYNESILLLETNECVAISLEVRVISCGPNIFAQISSGARN